MEADDFIYDDTYPELWDEDEFDPNFGESR